MAKNKREKGENSGSNKGVGILIGVLIVITWLSVMCLLIKCDVGGFGSRVLRPVFKDVPVINKILPDASDEEVGLKIEACMRNLHNVAAEPSSSYRWAISFVSATGLPLGTPEVFAKQVNKFVSEYLKQRRSQMCGIVFMDFVQRPEGLELLDCLIRGNN